MPDVRGSIQPTVGNPIIDQIRLRTHHSIYTGHYIETSSITLDNSVVE